MAELADDPLGYVLFNYPWGSSILPEDGPREWQEKMLRKWGHHIRKQESSRDAGRLIDPWLASIASGHGSGKSAMSAWATGFLHNTRPMAKGAVTASTMDQLRLRTWAEVGKWHKMSLTEHWSDYSTGQKMHLKNKKYDFAWACAAHRPAKENYISFQGQHSENASSYYIFDEASGVDDKFYEVARGGMARGKSDNHLWAFGNGNSPSGFFYRSHKDPVFSRIWVRANIDVRDVEGTSPRLWEDIIAEYGGEDNDVFRVRVMGQFPELAEYQFIPVSAVDLAQSIPSVDDMLAPLVMGVDLARGGGDRMVMWIRRGQNARDPCDDAGRKIPQPVRSWTKNDFAIAEDTIHDLAHQYRFRSIFVETHGMGAPVIEHLQRRGVPNLIPVNLQTNWAKSGKFADRKTMMIASMKEAMVNGMLALPSQTPQDIDALPKEVQRNYGGDLRLELLSIEAGLTNTGLLKVAPNPQGKPHYDFAMALALTYSHPGTIAGPEFGQPYEDMKWAMGNRVRARSPLDRRPQIMRNMRSWS